MTVHRHLAGAAVLTVRLTVVAAGASAAVMACEPTRPEDPVTVATSASVPSGCTTLALFETDTGITTDAPTITVGKVACIVADMIGGTW